MKRFVIVFALIAIIATGTAFADHPKGFGIGIVGSYSNWGFGGTGGGLSLKIPDVPIFWAINASVGENYLGFGVTGDCYTIDKKLGGPFHWFMGLGGYVNYYSYNEKYNYVIGTADYSYSWIYAGGRLPIGLSFQPIPLLEIFIDIAPSIGVGVYSGYEVEGTGYNRKEDGSVGLGWGAPIELGIRLWF